MGSWGDEYEVVREEEQQIKIGYVVSFKTMSFLIHKIREETKEYNGKHPKEELMSMWVNIMVVFLVLFTFTYSILISVTGVFFFFYFYVLVQLYGAWKQFKYSKGYFWGITAVGMIAAAVLGTLLRNFAMSMI